MGDSKSAIDNYSKALVLDPNDGIAYYNRANEKMLLNDVNGAIEDYRKLNNHRFVKHKYIF